MTETEETIVVNKSDYVELVAFVRDVRNAIVRDYTIVKSPDFIADDAKWFADRARKLLKKKVAAP